MKKRKVCKECKIRGLSWNNKSGLCPNCYIKVWKEEHYNGCKPKKYCYNYHGIGGYNGKK